MRRRLRLRPDPLPPSAADVPAPSEVQRALRLGWSIAETFGRLRVYQPEHATRRNDPGEMPRFSFSNSDLSGAQRLEVSYRRMQELAAALALPPPPVDELILPVLLDPPQPIGDDEKKAIHAALEAWSRAVWVQLNVRSAALGRAMTYGGSLADTYWYLAPPGDPAFLSGRRSVEALLRAHRLRRIQERMDEIDEAFTPATCDAIRHSLQTWIYDAAKDAWARAESWRGLDVAVDERPRRTPAQQLHFNLERQARTWRDLLFEARQPLDFVSPRARRWAAVLADITTLALVIALALAVGLLVFGLFGMGVRLVQRLGLTASVDDQWIEALSVLISLTSTLVVVAVGLLARLSTLVQRVDAALETCLLQREIRRRTTIPWNDPPRPAPEGTG
ncbi:hypothetical protein [Kallotenue papyrolyticum]|uniref:hypothetical protein n=1 Tax=Kallotenue papyrolyticum TaxID=1325125 RepID=UPI0004786343|nr:hypothetical protein [Kallotenue papyrolyticum]